MTQSAALSRTLFPVGDLPKPEVRRIAEELKLPTARKKDSTGICFIGERDFRPFLQKYLQAQPGDFRNLDGKKVGTHHGSAYYTLGQRKGLGLGGQGEPWFVVAKDHAQNIVYVERGTDHPALYSQGLQAEAPFWIAGAAPMEVGQELECTAKVRYRQTDQPCFAQVLPDGSLSVRFPEPQRAVTPGQSVVLYQGEECLGGAIIRQAN
jgi:tRNA-specific 2-thiouridylase